MTEHTGTYRTYHFGRFVPWFVLSFLDRSKIWCWASLVLWKLYGDDNSPWRTSRCVDVIELEDGTLHLTCYCGYWDQANMQRISRPFAVESRRKLQQTMQAGT